MRVNYPTLVDFFKFQFCFLVCHREYTLCICGDEVLHTCRSLPHRLTWSALLVEWDHRIAVLHTKWPRDWDLSVDW